MNQFYCDLCQVKHYWRKVPKKADIRAVRHVGVWYFYTGKSSALVSHNETEYVLSRLLVKLDNESSDGPVKVGVCCYKAKLSRKFQHHIKNEQDQLQVSLRSILEQRMLVQQQQQARQPQSPSVAAATALAELESAIQGIGDLKAAAQALVAVLQMQQTQQQSESAATAAAGRSSQQDATVDFAQEASVAAAAAAAVAHCSLHSQMQSHLQQYKEALSVLQQQRQQERAQLELQAEILKWEADRLKREADNCF